MRATVNRPTIIMESARDERRRFNRHGDYVDRYLTAMIGYWLTRQRLASKDGLFGPWRRLQHLYKEYSWPWVTELQRYLPPECVAPGHKKIRSPRSGVSLDEIFLALGGNPPAKDTDRRDALRRLLDEPDYIIKGLATFNGLRKIVA